MQIIIWSNNELLPCYEEPQKLLVLSLPIIKIGYLFMPTEVGYKNNFPENKNFKYETYIFIVFGLGFCYNKNWDID